VKPGDQITWTLVQPSAWRREYELRDDTELVARLRVPTFRSGGDAEVGGQRLQIQRRGRLRASYGVVDEASGGEIARVGREGRRRFLELDGRTYQWERLGRSFGFVGDGDQPLVTARVRSGIMRSSGEVAIEPGVDERQAAVAALLACYLLIRRNDEAAGAAAGTVAATAGG
jgi:hypothetical protein